MRKLKQIKLHVIPNKEYNYVLTRLNDGLVKRGDVAKYIQWNEDGTANTMIDTPEIGCSLVINPGIGYVWLTTPIVEIIKHTENDFIFKTENSDYQLTTL